MKKQENSPPKKGLQYTAGSAASLAAIVDHVPDIIFEFCEKPNGDAEFTYVSNAVRDIAETEPSELLKDASVATDLLHPDDRDTFYDHLLRSRANDDSTASWQGRILGKRSHCVKWVKISARPEKIADGSIKWRGVASDITHLKTVEQELLAARHKAREEARTKEQFLATMSHEIRTPLNGILGMSDILAIDARPDQEEHLKLLQFSANNLMSLINNILDFSKLDSGKMIVAERKMNLRRVLQSLQKIHAYKANGNRTEVVFNVDDSIPDVVRTDEMIFTQVLNNLLGNAVKFTKDGSVTLSLRAQSIIGDRMVVNVAVVDTGVGIAPEHLEKIFNDFEQAGEKQTGSSGLGLPICKKLLELMGSTLRVESSAGKGSRFFFDLEVGLLKDGKRSKSYSTSALH